MSTPNPFAPKEKSMEQKLIEIDSAIMKEINEIQMLQQSIDTARRKEVDVNFIAGENAKKKVNIEMLKSSLHVKP